MPGIYHEPIVHRLIDEFGFRSAEFKQAVRAAIIRTAKPEEQDPAEADVVADDIFARFTRRPDAYYLNESERALLVVEVEHAHLLSPECLEDYQDLWWAFDSHGCWFMELLTVDRYGTFRHVNLCDGHKDGYYRDDAVNTIDGNEKTPATAAIMARLMGRT